MELYMVAICNGCGEQIESNGLAPPGCGRQNQSRPLTVAFTDAYGYILCLGAAAQRRGNSLTARGGGQPAVLGSDGSCGPMLPSLRYTARLQLNRQTPAALSSPLLALSPRILISGPTPATKIRLC